MEFAANDHGIEKGLIPRGQPLAQNQFGSKLVARILVAFW